MSNHTNHTLQVPASIWAWAEKQGKLAKQGPAWFLRNILIGAMAGAMTAPWEPDPEFTPTPAPAPNGMMFKTRPDERAAHWKEILEYFKGWKFQDPKGKMRMASEEARDFCHNMLIEDVSYEYWHPNAQSLFKMLCDVYRRQNNYAET